MHFELSKSIQILERTPETLNAMLLGISEDWTQHNEGGETWSVFDVLGHLIHGEKTDWIDRTEITLGLRDTTTYTPFDRFAQKQDSVGKTLTQLLSEFETRRKANIKKLKSYHITEADLAKTATHPALGNVSLRNLLSTWTVHDLNHISQIARVMAFQLKEEAGPWQQYLRILK